MKAFKLFVVAMILGVAGMLLAPANGAFAQQTAPVVNQPAVTGILHIIDVDQPLPKTIDIARNEILVFARLTPTVGTDVTVDQQQMACFACITMLPVNLFAPPKGAAVYVSVTSHVTGFATFAITHHVPHGPSHTETVTVRVH
jgi:hypothetical protein